MSLQALTWGVAAATSPAVLAQTIEPEGASAPAAAAAAASAPGVSLNRVVVPGKRSYEVGPLPGLAVTKDQIPANVQSATKEQIKNSRALNIGDYMNSQMQGVSANDYAGNPYQLDINYRGFTASPQVGTPQGLSVFFDGVRVNEPFGDVVNWDLIPLNAIDRFDLFPGSNPLFGLNTLGGAIALRSKSGFTSPGVEASVTAGSWKRRQVQLSGGVNDGTFAGFLAYTGFQENGWRDNSPSRVNQLFGRGDWAFDRGSVSAAVLAANNDLIGNGLIPNRLYEERPESIFTAPDQSRNKLLQFTLSGAFEVTSVMNITGQVYRRKSNRKGVNGDVYEGFENFFEERDVSRGPKIKRNPDLPYCRGFAPDGSGTLYGPDVVFFNGPPSADRINGTDTEPGVGCTFGRYEQAIPRNGATATVGGVEGVGPGVVEGTPIGLINKTELGQLTSGGAVQLNWNLERHKLMVGASIDRSRADYDLRQRLGLMDASRRVYEDPANIDEIYRAAQADVVANSFDGNARTNSLYGSETWTPREDVDVSVAARYNRTRVRSRLFVRSAEGIADIHRIRNRNVVAPFAIVCPTLDPASCPDEPNAVPFDFNGNAGRQTRTSDEFTYKSFNPSFGINFRPTDSLNLFTNLSRGARVPSVVELGCAFDATPVSNPAFPNEPAFSRSQLGPSCNLPTTLSGDPFLPQIRATSGEVGVRGSLGGGWQWNTSVFRTDLKNDIYFVGVGDGKSYFDTIGKTRRQGLEAGVEGKLGAFDIKAGYSYTSATFESVFYTYNPNNSSADFNQNSRGPNSLESALFLNGTPTATATENRGFGTYQQTRIDPGARLPGIPAHALNLSAGYHVTPQWKLGLQMIARSMSYMRGNENNRHQPTGTDQETGAYSCQIDTCELSGLTQASVDPGRPFTQKGTVSGFAIFNFDTSVDLGSGLTLTAQISNLFDRRYFSAGRLGVNPFTPGQNGANGPSGWNYNSNEWELSSFVAPGAPRGIFVGLSWAFDAKE